MFFADFVGEFCGIHLKINCINGKTNQLLVAEAWSIFAYIFNNQHVKGKGCVGVLNWKPSNSADMENHMKNATTLIYSNFCKNARGDIIFATDRRKNNTVKKLAFAY